ncbi:hypothetical protein B566_EDAN016434 [Ephemera danica]|nr:hypothetical protein B566_EDAN016434 [Ephemera danica]
MMQSDEVPLQRSKWSKAMIQFYDRCNNSRRIEYIVLQYVGHESQLAFRQVVFHSREGRTHYTQSVSCFSVPVEACSNTKARFLSYQQRITKTKTVFCDCELLAPMIRRWPHAQA